MKILIIEDDPDLRDSLHELLEIHQHTVIVAADGAGGVRLAKDALPDLIFCDITMPAMDGYEVITAVRQHPPCCDSTFIFLTARTNRSDFRHGMQLGADDYITKPFSKQDIVEAISARLRRRQPLQEHVTQLLAERRFAAEAPWSHELMTPLCGILTGLELLESFPVPSDRDQQEKVIAIIRGGAARQHALARKLVTYYELERLKGASPPPAGYTTDAVAALAAGTSRVAAAHGREADLVAHFAPGAVAVSETHLIAAVSELVDNAFRFSTRGQIVEVTGLDAGTRYRIDLVDRGISMTAAQRAEVGAFRQFDRERREQQGLGLGLEIARSVAKIAGGDLVLAPGPGGQGLKVTLWLPTGLKDEAAHLDWLPPEPDDNRDSNQAEFLRIARFETAG
jgi:CheY-like chemotaxis protein